MKDTWMNCLKNDVRNLILDEYRETKDAIRDESVWEAGNEAWPDS